MNHRHNMSLSLMLTLVLIIVLFCLPVASGVSISIVSPTRGKVGDTVNLNGAITQNGDWIILFDKDSSGTFDLSEERTSGRAPASGIVSSSFIVPPCCGSDMGTNHMVGLLDLNASTVVTAYPPKVLATTNFQVVTDRTLTTPSSVDAGNPIEIALTITGGLGNTTYTYTVTMISPNGQTATAPLTANSNSEGYAQSTISYPNAFLTANTNQAGTYQITLTESSPNNSIRLNSNTQVQEPHGQVTPTPTPAHQVPMAFINSITPNPVQEGASVTFNGYGEASNGYVITAYQWTSSISGELGTTSTFTLDSLPVGTHTISLRVQDETGLWSQPATLTLEITQNPDQPQEQTDQWGPLLPYVFVGLVSLAAIVGGSIAVWMHQGALTSQKVKSKLKKQKDQEAEKEQEQKQKDEKTLQRLRLKQKPFLVFSKMNIPENILRDSVYTAELSIRNIGTGNAENIVIEALPNPFLHFDNSSARIQKLSAGEAANVQLKYVAGSDVRKDVYQVQFRVYSDQTEPKLKKAFIRGGSIALLTDNALSEQTELVRLWLKKNSLPYEEIHDASHLMTQLYRFDLLLVALENTVSSKWAQNICTYVDNSQSIFVFNRIIADPDAFSQTLGYTGVKYQPLNINDATLTINCQHPVTEGFAAGEKINLGGCTGNVCFFSETNAAVLAYVSGAQGGMNHFPGVVAKESGQGKIVHLNFRAQPHLDHVDRLVKNAVNWLLWG